MEAIKSRPGDIAKEIEKRREQRKAKEMARAEKIRAINLQKYSKQNSNKSVFLNDKSSGTQCRPRNFKSMTDCNTLQSTSLRSNVTVAGPTTGNKSGNIQARKSNIPQRRSIMVAGPLTANKECNQSEKSFTSQRESIAVAGLSTSNKFSIQAHKSIIPQRKSIMVAGPLTANKECNQSEKSFTSQKESMAVAGPSTTNKSANNQTRKSIIPQKKSIMVAGPLTVNKSGHNHAGKGSTSQRKSIAVAGPSATNKFGHSQTRKSIIPQRKSSTASGTSAAHKSGFINARKSIMPQMKNVASDNSGKFDIKRPPVPKHLHATVNQKPSQRSTKGPAKTSKLSVFERLYQPKRSAVSHRKNGGFEQKTSTVAPHKRKVLAPIDVAKNAAIRRSISAVHFKRIGKHELSNCFHRCSSVKELNQIDLTDQDPNPEIVNSIRSERKKVKFLTATPRADELQSKLKAWLQSRGKTLTTYPHLRCFGVHRPIEHDHYDEENKENISADISDDGSFKELMIDDSPSKDDCKTNWRRASLNDSEALSEFSKSMSRTPTSMETPMPEPMVDQLLLGALTDLSQLIREGYDWEQCARWLRCVRSRWPHAPTLAAYWECLAALKQCCGDLTGSIQCWEEAIAKGAKTSVAEASLDQMLDKFTQLKINPSSAGGNLTRPHHMNTKNGLKSTLIHFAVMNARAKQTTAAYTVTPVRRSHRLSVVHPGRDTPAHKSPLVQIATSLRDIDHEIRDNSVFVPNKLLQYSP